MRTNPEKFRPILDNPSARNIKELRRILGMLSWYRKFLPNFSGKIAPLTRSIWRELLNMACNYLKADKEDKYFNIAKVWADKLKELEPQQRMYAEKGINDILFEASMNSLNKNSVKINVETNQVPFQVPDRTYTSQLYTSGSSSVVTSPPGCITCLTRPLLHLSRVFLNLPLIRHITRSYNLPSYNFVEQKLVLRMLFLSSTS
ncbi:uncharacterized protein LOC113470562 [Diaphorina citri]|uniref:Uncharacterized protein LOC113470562 n=1 Tax=Diaphorina citri TaxID=121845 RepID=A0A3Q0J8V8_DIACI|nr:uncharacterized protein LOC113470562 [Diaphorina citri]